MAKTIYLAEYRQLVDTLRERREKLGISQTALSRTLGWNQQRISYIERGARRLEVFEYLALARALGWSPLVALRRAEQAKAPKRGK